MQVQENEIWFIYNSNDLQERRAFGYAAASGKYVVKEFDLDKDDLTERQVIEIAQRLGVPLAKLMENSEERNLRDEEVPKYLVQNPRHIRTPIVLYHDSADFIESSFDFINKN